MARLTKQDLLGEEERSKKYPYILKWELPDLAYAIWQTKELYRYNVEMRTKMINHDMKSIYGRPIYFKESQTTAMEIAIKDVIKTTNCSLKEVATQINNYMGEKMCYFRQEGERRVPVELERIKKAYLAVRRGAGRNAITRILYE